MSEITLNAEHVSQALARLAEQFKDKPNLAALISIYVAKAQELEEVLWDVFILRSIENATAHQLDMLGAIVGQARLGMVDDDYRLCIRARIRVNLSSGTTNELLGIIRPLVTGGTVSLVDEPVAGFTLTIGGTPTTETDATLLLGFLRAAKAAGVHGILHWTPSAGNQGFAFNSPSLPGFDDGELDGALS